MIIELTLLLAFSATLLRTLLLAMVSFIQENSPPPITPVSCSTASSLCSDIGAEEVSPCICCVRTPVCACGCFCTGSLLWSTSWIALSLDTSSSEDLATKVGSAEGGAMFDRRFPVDVDTPRGVNREADDERLLMDSKKKKQTKNHENV